MTPRQKAIHRLAVIAYDDTTDGERTERIELDVQAASEHEARRRAVEEVLRTGMWVWEIGMRG